MTEKKKRQDFEVPEGSILETCSKCGAGMYRVRHPRTGNVMPLAASTIEVREGKRFAVSHFADCPHAPSFRKTRDPQERRP